MNNNVNDITPTSTPSASTWEDIDDYPPLGTQIKKPNRQPSPPISLPSTEDITENAPPAVNLQSYHAFYESKPTIKILPRKKDNTVVENAPKKPIKTLEEKLADYERARAALFNDESSTNDISNSNTSNNSSNNNNTTVSKTQPPTLNTNSPQYLPSPNSQSPPYVNSPKSSDRVYSPGSFKRDNNYTNNNSNNTNNSNSNSISNNNTNNTNNTNNNNNNNNNGKGFRQPVGPDGTQGFRQGGGRGGRRNLNSGYNK